MKSIIIIYNNIANNQEKKSLSNKKLLYEPEEKCHRKIIFLTIYTFFGEIKPKSIMSWHPDGCPRPHETKGNETEHSNEEENEELVKEDSDDDCYVYDDEESILTEEKNQLLKNKAMVEEHISCKRWIECPLVSSFVQTKTGKELKCLCHDENKRKCFNASPEYREFFKELIGMEIEIMKI